MKVLVVGANGKTGKQVVELLAEDDHEVVAMVRDRSQIPEMKSMGAKPVFTDLEFDIEFAVEGVEAVIFVAGAGPDANPHQVDLVEREGAVKLIEACERNSVERFILLSAKGAGHPEKAPDHLKAYFQAKKTADDRLMKSRLNYTIIRSGSLNNDDERGAVTAATHLGASNGEVSRADIARVIFNALENPATYRKIIEVIGGDQPIEQALKTL